LALTTFVFPDSSSKSPSTAPSLEDIILPETASAQSVPDTPNVFSSFSYDSSLAFTIPYENVADFLREVQEIPDPSADNDVGEQRKWIMKVTRGAAYGSRGAFKIWVSDAWTSFMDLIKVCRGYQ
jgi:hydroxymethylglutaryl-CoA reductase (NADPH)